MIANSRRLRVSVVGYGYWGPNLVRNIVEGSDFWLHSLCELNEVRGAEFSRRYPTIPVQRSFDAVLVDPEVDAVVIATPPRTHYELAMRAMGVGKHVLVEKPLATSGAAAQDMLAAAELHGVTLMPGHTFLYSPRVTKVRQLIDEGVLGDPYFVTSSRMNLGIHQPDGVVCDLAPHDLSILLYWLRKPITQVSASGRSMLGHGVPDTAFLTLTFEGGATANVQVSWLAPRKVRQMVVVGSRQMVVYDDTSPDESIRLYDRGFDIQQEPATFGEYQLTYRSGDMVVPRIDAAEPLGLELQDFARAIRTGEAPRSSPTLGLEIVRALEAAHTSLKNNGEPVTLEPRVRELITLPTAQAEAA